MLRVQTGQGTQFGDLSRHSVHSFRLEGQQTHQVSSARGTGGLLPDWIVCRAEFWVTAGVWHGFLLRTTVSWGSSIAFRVWR